MREEDELILLEELEATEVSKELIFFMGIGTDPEYYESHFENEYLNRLFPKPMKEDEISQICSREKLGCVIFFSCVDGSKPLESEKLKCNLL